MVSRKGRDIITIYVHLEASLQLYSDFHDLQREMKRIKGADLSLLPEEELGGVMGASMHPLCVGQKLPESLFFLSTMPGSTT
jgi:hypothetical protein